MISCGFTFKNVKKLCSSQKQAENVHVTLFRALSLIEYIYTRSVYCQEKHVQPCSKCSTMLNIAKSVATNGYCQLATGYRSAFPLQAYKPDIARQRLLQMPLACIRLGDLRKGTSCWYLVEYVQGVDYVKFACFANALQTTRQSRSLTIDKAHVKALLGLARSDRERELIRYSVFKSSGLSATAARKTFGFESMHVRSSRVESAIEEARSIHEAIDAVARIQDKAMLASMGFDISSESDTESDVESDHDVQKVGMHPESLPIRAHSTAGIGMHPESLPINAHSSAGVGMHPESLPVNARTESLPVRTHSTAGIGMHPESLPINAHSSAGVGMHPESLPINARTESLHVRAHSTAGIGMHPESLPINAHSSAGVGMHPESLPVNARTESLPIRAHSTAEIGMHPDSLPVRAHSTAGFGMHPESLPVNAQSTAGVSMQESLPIELCVVARVGMQDSLPIEPHGTAGVGMQESSPIEPRHHLGVCCKWNFFEIVTEVET